MPNHVACCTYPVLDWLAEHMPEVPINIMDRFHPDNFCDLGASKYRPQYEDIARRPMPRERRDASSYAERLGLPFEAVTYGRARLGALYCQR